MTPLCRFENVEAAYYMSEKEFRNTWIEYWNRYDKGSIDRAWAQYQNNPMPFGYLDNLFIKIKQNEQ